MKDQFWRWVFGGAGALILLFAARYVISQEVEKQVAPIEARERQLNATVEAVLFQQRLAEDRELTAKCEEAERTDCESESDWRWETYYPWADCAAQYKDPKERTDACGPKPRYERPDG